MRKQALVLVLASLASLEGCDSAGPASGPAAPGQQVQPADARHQMDRARNRMWSLTSEGVFVQDAPPSRKIQVSLPGWVWAGEAYGCPPDLALGPKGEAVITSNVIPTLWRVDPDTLAVSEHPLALNADDGKDVGFSRLVYSSEHGAFIGVSDAHGSQWRIDASLTKGEKVAQAAPVREACGAMGARG